MPVHNEEVQPSNATLAGLVRGQHERHLDKKGLGQRGGANPRE